MTPRPCPVRRAARSHWATLEIVLEVALGRRFLTAGFASTSTPREPARSCAATPTSTSTAEGNPPGPARSGRRPRPTRRREPPSPTRPGPLHPTRHATAATTAREPQEPAPAPEGLRPPPPGGRPGRRPEPLPARPRAGGGRDPEGTGRDHHRGRTSRSLGPHHVLSYRWVSIIILGLTGKERCP